MSVATNGQLGGKTGGDESVTTTAGQSVAIDRAPADDRGADVMVYRAATADRPFTLVKSFAVNGRRRKALWDGAINGRAAPPGTYVIGIRVLDAACTTGQSKTQNQGIGKPPAVTLR